MCRSYRMTSCWRLVPPWLSITKPSPTAIPLGRTCSRLIPHRLLSGETDSRWACTGLCVLKLSDETFADPADKLIVIEFGVHVQVESPAYSRMESGAAPYASSRTSRR